MGSGRNRPSLGAVGERRDTMGGGQRNLRPAPAIPSPELSRAAPRGRTAGLRLPYVWPDVVIRRREPTDLGGVAPRRAQPGGGGLRDAGQLLPLPHCDPL